MNQPPHHKYLGVRRSSSLDDLEKYQQQATLADEYYFDASSSLSIAEELEGQVDESNILILDHMDNLLEEINQDKTSSTATQPTIANFSPKSSLEQQKEQQHHIQETGFFGMKPRRVFFASRNNWYTKPVESKNGDVVRTEVGMQQHQHGKMSLLNRDAVSLCRAISAAQSSSTANRSAYEESLMKKGSVQTLPGMLHRHKIR